MNIILFSIIVLVSTDMVTKRDVVLELHKPCRKKFIRRKVIMISMDDHWQIDLVEMGAYSKENKGYKFLLTIIDTFSKCAWAVPIKNKTGVEVTTAMESVFDNSKRIPKNMQSDDGKEFFNKYFQTLMHKYKINHYSTYSSLKASIVERFNRTLKHLMWIEFSVNGNYRWIDKIDMLLHKYNNTYHRTIMMRPAEVNKTNEKSLLSTVYNRIKTTTQPKFQIGDSVRISKYKHVFEKGYTPNWTTEVFGIRKIQFTNPITYLLEDYERNPIKGSFYELELAKPKNPNVFLVEKILKKRGDMVLVKWLGFSSAHNSWIKNKDII